MVFLISTGPVSEGAIFPYPISQRLRILVNLDGNGNSKKAQTEAADNRREA